MLRQPLHCEPDAYGPHHAESPSAAEREVRRSHQLSAQRTIHWAQVPGVAPLSEI